MEIYYIIHIAVFASLVFEFFPLRFKKGLLVLWCLFFTLFGGLRWKIGGDWDQYYGHFLNVSWDNIFNYDRYGNGQEVLEPGFVFFNVFIRTLFGEFYIYNLIVVGFIQFSYYKFCNYFFSKHPLLCYSFLMLLSSNYFAVRAGFGLGITYWCWKFIKERKLLPYLVIIFIAYSVHRQAIVLLPCYWIGKVKLKSKWLLIIYLLIAFFSYKLQAYFTLFTLQFSGTVADAAYGYTQNETEGFSGVSYAGWALNYFFLIIYLYIRRKKNLYDDFWNNTLLNCVIIYNAIFMVFSNGMGDLSRLSVLYFPVQCILLIYSFLYFVESKNKVISMLAVIFFLSYYIYRLPYTWSGYFFKDACVPYKTILDYGAE